MADIRKHTDGDRYYVVNGMNASKPFTSYDDACNCALYVANREKVPVAEISVVKCVAVVNAVIQKVGN